MQQKKLYLYTRAVPLTTGTAILAIETAPITTETVQHAKETAALASRAALLATGTAYSLRNYVSNFRNSFIIAS